MKTVIGYVRVSTDIQESKRQIMQCQDYCKANNYHLKDIIQDNGVSGVKGIDEREGLKVLMNLNNDDCDIIFISELSRFSRQDSMITVANQLKEITDKNILIYIHNTQKTISKGFDKNILDVITLVVESDANAKERIRIQQRMLSGKRSKMIKEPKSCLGSKMAFGFTRDENKNILINKNESEFIVQMFDLYSKGYSTKYLAQLLHDNFNNCNDIAIINKFLCDKRYTGYFEFNILGEKICKQYEHLRLISDELFIKVQDIKKTKRANVQCARGENNKKSLLRNVLFCGCCGKYYKFDVKENNVPFYRCSTKKTAKKTFCDNSTSFRGQRIETIIFNAVANILFYKDANENKENKIKEYTDKIEYLLNNKKQIDENDDKLLAQLKRYRVMSIKHNYTDNEIDEYENDVKETLQNNKKQIDNINNEVAYLYKKIEFLNNDTEIKYIDENDELIEKKNLINNYIEKIFVHNYSDFAMLEIIHKDDLIQYVFTPKKYSDKWFYFFLNGDLFNLIDGVFSLKEIHVNNKYFGDYTLLNNMTVTEVYNKLIENDKFKIIVNKPILSVSKDFK